MKNVELVSIITPSYNSAQFIEETIRSVQQQTYTNWEMLITDDCSNDNTVEIIKQFADNDLRIRYFVLDKNKGAAVARNNSLDHAKGKYLAFLDSDDVWKPTKLEFQIQFMECNGYAFTYSSYDIINEAGELLTKTVKITEKIDYRKYLRNSVIGCLTVVINREMTGDFRMPDMRSSQDMATWLLVLKRCGEAYGINKSLAKYRLVKNSVSSRKIKSAVTVWAVYRNIEKLSILYSLFNLNGYSFNAMLKRLDIQLERLNIRKVSNGFQFFLKRLFDIIFSVTGIIVLFPLFLMIGILIKADSKGPVFFRQKRLGLNGSIFNIFKFRTMVENAEFIGTGLFNYNDDPRVTKIGRFLRNNSLDELPQIFNILNGEMSFVGPRPPVTYELGDYADFDFMLKKRFTVKPGVTGFAQINGRNELSWDEKIIYDNKYINDFYKYGIFLDLKIVLFTIYKVFKNEGSYELMENAEKDRERVKKQ